SGTESTKTAMRIRCAGYHSLLSTEKIEEAFPRCDRMRLVGSIEVDLYLRQFGGGFRHVGLFEVGHLLFQAQLELGGGIYGFRNPILKKTVLSQPLIEIRRCGTEIGRGLLERGNSRVGDSRWIVGCQQRAPHAIHGEEYVLCVVGCIKNDV